MTSNFHTPVVLIVRADRHNHFTVFLEGRVIIERTRQPLLDGARELLGMGFDPGMVVQLRREATPERIDMVSRIGVAAGLTVSESDSDAPRLRKYKPHPMARQQ